MMERKVRFPSRFAFPTLPKSTSLDGSIQLRDFFVEVSVISLLLLWKGGEDSSCVIVRFTGSVIEGTAAAAQGCEASPHGIATSVTTGRARGGIESGLIANAEDSEGWLAAFEYRK